MQVENKTMYHIHTPNKYDEMWQEGNELIIDDNFYSECGLSIPYFNTDVVCSNGSLISIVGPLRKYLDEGIEKLTMEEIKTIFEDVYRILYNNNRTKCEAALEICRREKFKLCPSRLHSLWVTDKDNLDYWLNILNGKEIYELNLTGTLFKTSDIYIPDDNLSLVQAIKAAESYWNPNFTEEAEEKKEYLFQGTALIKRKIK
ncbi:putative uncharacterized protein [Firmicutes bacterium CAG:822]|nr:putative uncharacterized protein [Firmicutes bacterium CAG:822]